MSVADNLKNVMKEIPQGVRLVAVSKTNPAESILEAYNEGQNIFGESRVQELVPKYQLLPKEIDWHLIGHLQTNKVKYIAPFVSLIHSADSLQLLEEINRQAIKYSRVINCLLQVHIAEEETKFGFSESELYQLLESHSIKELNNIKICGLMGMATLTENKSQIRKEFKHLYRLFNSVKTSGLINKQSFNEISMGMSSDYIIAIEEGSTMVRIGSKIFGERILKNNTDN